MSAGETPDRAEMDLRTKLAPEGVAEGTERADTLDQDAPPPPESQADAERNEEDAALLWRQRAANNLRHPYQWLNSDNVARELLLAAVIGLLLFWAASALENAREVRAEVRENARFVRQTAMDPDALVKPFAALHLEGATLGGLPLGCPEGVGSIGPGCADFSEAHLSHADLGGVDLSGANLEGANLSRANLTVANLAEAYVYDADLSGASLAGAVLIRAGLGSANLGGAFLIDANLSGALLIDADLRGADLSGALLTDADLRGADLSGADLSGADLSGADLSEAELSRVCYTAEQSDDNDPATEWPGGFDAPPPDC